MKKFFIIGLAVIFCLALTAPAMAKVTIGGMITTDFYYHDQDGEVTTPTVQGTVNGDNGNTQLSINVPQSNNRLIVKYASDDKKLTGYIQLRGGGVPGGAGNGTTIDYKYAWFDYKLNDAVHFRFGRQPQAFSNKTPFAANMGYVDGFTLLVNYGNIQVTDGDSVKLYWKFNNNVRLELQLEDPGEDDGEAPIGAAAQATPAGANAAVVREENTLPRFDIALPIKIGKLSLEPAFSYLKQEYDQVAAGIEDNVDIWGFSLGGSIGFGPVTFWGEFNFGENLGDDTHTTSTPGTLPAAVARLVDVDGDGTAETIADSDYVGGWIQMGFNFGSATLLMAVGMEKIDNDGAPGAADDIDGTRVGYAVSLPIKVAKNFTVQPAFIYHDKDNDALAGAANPLTTDYGDELLIGVQFLLTF